MMDAPFYKTAAASAEVLQLLGDPPRIYPWGENTDEARAYPYVTFQGVGGVPLNYLSGRPDCDREALQVDIWAKTPGDARAVRRALSQAIELSCYVTAWRGEQRDPATGSYRTGFDCDWHTLRSL